MCVYAVCLEGLLYETRLSQSGLRHIKAFSSSNTGATQRDIKQLQRILKAKYTFSKGP